jgi:hypothetical protein
MTEKGAYSPFSKNSVPAHLGTAPQIGNGLARLGSAAAAVASLVGCALAIGIFRKRLFLLLLGLSLLLDFLQDFLFCKKAGI